MSGLTQGLQNYGDRRHATWRSNDLETPPALPRMYSRTAVWGIVRTVPNKVIQDLLGPGLPLPDVFSMGTLRDGALPRGRRSVSACTQQHFLHLASQRVRMMFLPVVSESFSVLRSAIPAINCVLPFSEGALSV